MKLCKDCAFFRADSLGYQFARCMHGAETKTTINPISGEQSTFVLDSLCEIKRELSPLAKLYRNVRDSVNKGIDEGASTLEPRYWPCGPEARYFVERPVIIQLLEPETRWQRFVSWLRSWL